jgi:Clp amino terminal domain, pathogenicity island component
MRTVSTDEVAIDGEATRALPERVQEALGELAGAAKEDDLFLVAIAGLDEEQPARRALAAEGIDEGRLLSLVRVGGDGPPAAPLTFSPAYFQMEGRAQGFAAVLGDGRITPEHVLLALLWDPSSTSSYLLWRLGIPRERIVEHLHDFSIPTPTAPLPRQREIEWGPRVWFGRTQVRRVVDHLRARIPPGTRWGFNYDGDRA